MICESCVLKRSASNGPIADDGVAYLLNLYEDGLRTLEEQAKELEYEDLNSQYCFLTEKAVSLLRRINK